MHNVTNYDIFVKSFLLKTKINWAILHPYESIRQFRRPKKVTDQEEGKRDGSIKIFSPNRYRYLTPYDLCAIFSNVRWVVEIDDEFKLEFFELHEDVRTEILALSRLLQQFGPQLKRPRVDTLNGSRHPNMKELRFSAAGGEWRVAFAFDTKPPFWRLEINRKSAKNGFTGNSSAGPTTASMPIQHG